MSDLITLTLAEARDGLKAKRFSSSWDLFRAADYFLYLRSSIGKDASAWNAWIPWSVIYLREPPEFVQLAVSKDRAERLATGLGLAGVTGLGERLQTTTLKLKEFYRSSFWRPPGQYFDWSKIASR